MLNSISCSSVASVFRGAVILTAIGLALLLRAEDFQGSTHKVPYDGEVIDYEHRMPDDAVTRLQKRLEAGEANLQFDPKFGYLPALLESLDVPKSSQMLVFSKTSLQRHLISPQNPRALFYNDDVYIGFIPGSPLMEISTVDPKLGGVFYTLEQTEKSKPRFSRSSECLQCHGSGRTLGVPGHFVRSIATDKSGELDGPSEASGITHCTPFSDRWAGWYVTGTNQGQMHRGNLVGQDAFDEKAKDPEYFENITDLKQFFDVTKYPEPGSDIVALTVLTHQTHMHNYITRLNAEAQIMLKQYGHIRYLKNQVNAFLRYLLFTEEAPLAGPLKGNPAFVKQFAERSLRDKQGRSLRDFDLHARIFKYPCSFLIYSAAFDSMVPEIREHLLQRLYSILTGEDQNPAFATLISEDRQAIREILHDTKTNLPEYWKRTPY